MSDLDQFINALQLCIKSEISSITQAGNDNDAVITFDSEVKDDTGLEIFEKLIPGHWNEKQDAYSMSGISINFDFELITQFLLLTRLKADNMLKLAELDSRYQPYVDQIFGKQHSRSSEEIQKIDQASRKIFEKAKHKTLTMRQLAELTGLTPMTLNNFKSGKDIKLSNLMKLCKAVGIKIKMES
ncbi:MAG: hypothetical protein A3G32_02140 [Deltaproteobacteria bacterium RIFCSPLOWO2_12_FULL_40_28]|nr:MAG: hypothetical protein A3C45_04445 [Deltaproteobacteria bacterium RIFCSPHIGHO2_02_FULL_40_28]OGQ21131.1 MAG: hypothetical protein A3E27_05205 [Deltaproteobacteria bacterium RIFCSPHIGHO2_12_FULL_40_32]OGQ39048.1 MAG: hypothetical protein A3I69_06870 [Deltaproteobacteria bacterium RIFCSPLOWO2_02_FULL_40_36]OGQ53095.1 MAG: hypothetical protein A3G32_02140 [Deltaproteobacteria bacterium RIFCSPLOWO2_12_FULL_40_28]